MSKKKTQKKQITPRITKNWLSPRVRFVILTCMFSVITYTAVMSIYMNISFLRGLLRKEAKGVPTTQRIAISYVDPFDVFTQIKKPNHDFVLIDIRSAKQFRKSHIRKSVNVPFDVRKQDTFVGEVKKVASGQHVIILPYSHFSTTGEQATSALQKAGVEADLVQIGWNELYNLPNMWLPEEEWQTFGFQELIQHDE